MYEFTLEVRTIPKGVRRLCVYRRYFGDEEVSLDPDRESGQLQAQGQPQQGQQDHDSPGALIVSPWTVEDPPDRTPSSKAWRSCGGRGDDPNIVLEAGNVKHDVWEIQLFGDEDTTLPRYHMMLPLAVCRDLFRQHICAWEGWLYCADYGTETMTPSDAGHVMTRYIANNMGVRLELRLTLVAHPIELPTGFFIVEDYVQQQQQQQENAAPPPEDADCTATTARGEELFYTLKSAMDAAKEENRNYTSLKKARQALRNQNAGAVTSITGA
ncbi:unnamed protein product [Amoebophrya sp. A25]|nr:unnamed protein product [Amoebophrya sp. A25]|eukprot:GSA25T00006456001.1